jgi:hypothetical protein
LQAIVDVKSPARLIVRSQGPLPIPLSKGHTVTAGHSATFRIGNVTVEYRIGTVPHESLWDEGDVLIHCTKWDGLSLPIQEARAAGMMVLTGDRKPFNEWLPPDSLIPLAGSRKTRIGPPYAEIEEAVYDPRDIAAAVDRVYGSDLTEYSETGRLYAESMSWAVLGPRYRAVLEGLL